ENASAVFFMVLILHEESTWPHAAARAVLFIGALARRRDASRRDGLKGHRSSRKAWRKGSKNQLGLGHQSHEPSLFGFQSCLPNLCPASAMKGRSGGDHGRALLGGTHEVRLALDCRSAIGACGEVYECGCTARRVGKRHRTAAVDGMAQGTKIATRGV